MLNFLKYRIGFAMVALVAILLLASTDLFAQQLKRETIEATAMGTSTQMGTIVNVTIIINGYSTPDDKTVLLNVFEQKGSEGLAHALDKMPSKGRIAITGTLGYDLNYIRNFNNPDGTRTIRFVTDRPITFGESWTMSRSMDYSLSMGEIIISPAKGKSNGKLFPAAQLKLDKKGELQIETLQNPWNLVNVRLSTKILK